MRWCRCRSARPRIRSDRRLLRAKEAYLAGDRAGVGEQLGKPWPERHWALAILQEPRRIALFSRSGLLAEAREVLAAFKARPERPAPPIAPRREILIPIMEAEVALAEGRAQTAVDLLTAALRGDWTQHGTDIRGPIYFLALQALASAWLELDDRENALQALELASRQKHRTHPFARESWMALQLQLASLYRELGRDQDALAIEAELRRLMVLADPDFWLVQKLKNLEGAATGPSAP